MTTPYPSPFSTPPRTPSGTPSSPSPFSAPCPNSPSFRRSPGFRTSPDRLGGRVPAPDISSRREAQGQLVENLVGAQAKGLSLLSSLDESLGSKTAEQIGGRLQVVLKDLAELAERLAGQISESEDGNEGLVDHLLQSVSGQPGCEDHEDYDRFKAALLTCVNTAPPVLADVAASLNQLTADELVEISEVGLSIGSISVTLARFTLEKLDVETIVEDMYADGGSRAAAIPAATRRTSRGVEFDDGIEYLDEEYIDSLSPQKAPFAPPPHRRKMKRLPLVFWPRLAATLVSQVTPASPSSPSPLSRKMSANPATAVLLAMLLLTPPPLILAALLLPPVLVTDEIAHFVYDKLRQSFPDTLETVEITAQQGVEIARLYLLLGRLFCKMSGNIASRQLRRKGGVRGVAALVGSEAVERLKHPVETAGMVWDGVKETWRSVGMIYKAATAAAL